MSPRSMPRRFMGLPSLARGHEGTKRNSTERTRPFAYYRLLGVVAVLSRSQLLALALSLIASFISFSLRTDLFVLYLGRRATVATARSTVPPPRPQLRPPQPLTRSPPQDTQDFSD